MEAVHSHHGLSFVPGTLVLVFKSRSTDPKYEFRPTKMNDNTLLPLETDILISVSASASQVCRRGCGFVTTCGTEGNLLESY